MGPYLREKPRGAKRRRLTQVRRSETVRADPGWGVMAMWRKVAKVALAGMACAGALVCLSPAPVLADDPVGAHPAVTDPGAPPVVRAPLGNAPIVRARDRHRPTRVRIYGTSPGPNSVRQCVAHYEQEFRVAGTVIVPRMHCWWEG